MSKHVGNAIKGLREIKNGASKFSASAVEGSRIVPNRSKDHQSSIRIDAGHFDPVTKELNYAVQVNSKAEEQIFKDWLKKKGSHANLTTGKFNTAAEDQDAEYVKVLDAVEIGVKESLSQLNPKKEKKKAKGKNDAKQAGDTSEGEASKGKAGLKNDDTSEEEASNGKAKLKNKGKRSRSSSRNRKGGKS